MSEELVLIATGALTAAGLSSRQVCTATRAGISAYEESDYILQTADWEPIIAATVPLYPKPTQGSSFGRLKALARFALEECLAQNKVDERKTVLLLGVREPHRINRLGDWVPQDLLLELQRGLGVTFHSASCVLPHGNASVFKGLLQAKELLRRGDVRWCIVGGVDSLLTSTDLGRLESCWRLNRDGEPQGLVPGEGAAFVTVTKPVWALNAPVLSRIEGVGLAQESSNSAVLNNGHPTGKGLERALAAAISDAGAKESDIGLRISDLNGERYGGIDAMLAVSRFYRTDRNGLPIWHPAETFGETGAAVGALLLIIGSDALIRGYSPAQTIMCEVSSESGMRGGCLLRGRGGKNSDPRPFFISPVQRPVLPFVLTQHAEEASFLWLNRSFGIQSAKYDLEDIEELDNRLDAHLDGLRIAEEPGWEICKEALGLEEVGEIFVASILALESGVSSRLDSVIEVGAKSYELSRGLVSALGWVPYELIRNILEGFVHADSPFLRRVGVAGLAIHRKDPGAVLGDFLDSEDWLLRARALKAVGELRRQDLLGKVKAGLASEDLACRFWAAWAGALLGERASLPVLQQLALEPSVFQERACALALRGLGAKAALDWHRELVARADLHRFAVQGVGVLGDPILLPWLFEQMAIPETARVAGESFSMITGLDLEYENFEGEWPEGFEAGPTENPEDEDVAMDPDEDLPWPNVELLEKWWHEHKKDFQKGTRYLCGEPMSIRSLNRVLRNGFQRQRLAAAMELAIHQPDTLLFETRAPGFRQQRLLGKGL